MNTIDKKIENIAGIKNSGSLEFLVGNEC